MSHHEFAHLLSSVSALSPEQMRTLCRKLESWMAVAEPTSSATANGDALEESAFDVASRAGLIGCIAGAPGSPTDLSTNPKHKQGFGRG